MVFKGHSVHWLQHLVGEYDEKIPRMRGEPYDR